MAAISSALLLAFVSFFSAFGRNNGPRRALGGLVLGNNNDGDSINNAALPSTGGDDDNDDNEKPIALVALTPTSRERLFAWLNENSEYLKGRTFLVPSDVAQALQWIPSLSGFMNVQEILGPIPTESQEVFDILLLGQIINGQISKVIVFPSDTTEEAKDGIPNMSMLTRACQMANVQLALNEATADLVLRSYSGGKIRVAYLIFNPVAGQGNPQEELRTIYETLEPQIVLTVVETLPGVDPAVQAKQIVEVIKARPDSSRISAMVLASGGDGTVSAVAGATMNTGIPFGVIPRGTANAFSVALGIPTDIRLACENLLEGNIRTVDGVMVNDTPMILLAGIGFEAGMVDNASREVKDVLGPLAYVLGGVKQFFEQETFECTVEVDGKKNTLQVAAITVATAAPATSVLAQGFGEVIPDDGLLDVTIGTAETRFEGLDALSTLLASAVVHRPLESDSLLCFRAKEVKISCNPPQKVVLDGEMLDMNPLEFKTLPGALKVIAPPKLL